MPAAKVAGIRLSATKTENSLPRWYNARAKQPMTNEEMQRAMDFIIEMEAKSSAKIDALAEAQTRNTEGITALLAIAEVHEKEIQANTQQILAQSQQIANLGQTTKSTDDRLNALINVVERQIGEGRNGQK